MSEDVVLCWRHRGGGCIELAHYIPLMLNSDFGVRVPMRFPHEASPLDHQAVRTELYTLNEGTW